jgi:CRP-like cAMP-binding protein
MSGTAAIDHFYIIKQGKVRCYKDDSVPGLSPVVLGPGDFVGVVSCMSGLSQIESVVALTDVVVIAVERSQYPELIKNNTPVALKIIRNFAAQMRTLNELLTRLTQGNVTPATPNQLFNVADYYFAMKQYNLAIFGFYQYLKACPTGEKATIAKKRFISLKTKTNAVYFENTPDTERFYPQNTMIFCESQTGNDMFIIQEGKVKITKVVNGNEVILAVLKKGDFFGEMALLENKPRSASAIAFEDCLLSVVNRSNFDRLVQTQPQLIARITTTFSDRIWSMNRNLVNTQISDLVMKLLDMLALQLEKLKTQFPAGMQYRFDFSPYDLANMCGIPKEKQALYMDQFMRDPHIKVQNNKIYVLDCADLIKVMAFHRAKAKPVKVVQ